MFWCSHSPLIDVNFEDHLFIYCGIARLFRFPLIKCLCIFTKYVFWKHAFTLYFMLILIISSICMLPEKCVNCYLRIECNSQIFSAQTNFDTLLLKNNRYYVNVCKRQKFETFINNHITFWQHSNRMCTTCFGSNH